MKKTLVLLLAVVLGGLLHALYQRGPDKGGASDAGERALAAWMAEIDRDIDSREVTAATRMVEWDRVVTLPATQDILRQYCGHPGFQEVMLQRMRLVRQTDTYPRAGEGYLPFLFCASVGLRPSTLLHQSNVHEVAISDLILALFADGSLDRSTWAQAFVPRKRLEAK